MDRSISELAVAVDTAADTVQQLAVKKAYRTPTFVDIDTRKTSHAANTVSDGTGNLYS
jgi:hypothetical protein